MPKVGIVISNYNGWQDTLVCLESLQRQTFTDFEIILIDDASPNDSVAQLQDKLPPNTVFLPQQQNVGFAAANMNAMIFPMIVGKLVGGVTAIGVAMLLVPKDENVPAPANTEAEAHS